jgi:anti-sigma factor RsiW
LAASVVIFAVGGIAGYEARTWMPEPAGAANRAQALSEIARSYKVFAVDGPRTVELGPDQRPLIERWFTRRLQHAVTMPDLSRHGLAFGGGRLMALEDGPVALAVYYTAERKPVGLCITPWLGGEVRPAIDTRGEARLVYWTSAGYLHVLIGETDPGFLMRLVDDAGQALAAPRPGGAPS